MKIPLTTARTQGSQINILIDLIKKNFKKLMVVIRFTDYCMDFDMPAVK